MLLFAVLHLGIEASLSWAMQDPIERLPIFAAICTYLGYAWLIFIGAIRDKIGWRGLMGLVGGSDAEKVEEGFAPLLADWEEFYMRRLFLRVHDVFDRPVCSAPGPFITIKLREFERLRVEIPLTGATKRCLNLGSYNYLGFATTGGAETQVYKSLEDHSVSTCSTRSELVRLPARLLSVVCCRYDLRLLPVRLRSRRARRRST